MKCLIPNLYPCKACFIEFPEKNESSYLNKGLCYANLQLIFFDPRLLLSKANYNRIKTNLSLHKSEVAIKSSPGAHFYPQVD